MKKIRKEIATGTTGWTRFAPAALIAIFAAQSFWHALDKSATYDEPGHLTTSYLMLKTDHRDYDIGHPPLVRYLFALPLLVMGPSLPAELEPPRVSPATPLSQLPGGSLYVYAAHFLYANKYKARTLLLWPRMVNILLGCMLGFWVYRLSKKFYGQDGAIFSLALFAFCPNLIAHSSLVTTDIGGLAFAFGFLYFFIQILEPRGAASAVWTGVWMGLALLSKFTNIFLVPFFAAVNLYSGKFRKSSLISTAVVLAAAWFVVCAGYRFDRVFVPHTLQESDWEELQFGKTFQNLYRVAPFPDSFIKGIAFGVHHDKRGHGSFLMGTYSGGGWWYYFPAAFLVKTPSVVLALILFGAYLLARFRPAITRFEIAAMVPAVFVMGTALTSKINIGLRHILICYPVIYLLAGRLSRLELFSPPRKKLFAGIVVALLAAETLSVSPHYLAFFNRLSGGPMNGKKYLSDSNLDWGQDLNNLAKFLKKSGDPELVLSYFGTAVPEYYDLKYQPLPTVWAYPKSMHTNSTDLKKEYLAVSVTNLQGTYFGMHDLYGWLRTRTPLAVIGYSIYVYDITSDLESQQRILELYRITGDLNRFLRQAAKVKQLEAGQAGASDR